MAHTKTFRDILQYIKKLRPEIGEEINHVNGCGVYGEEQRVLLKPSCYGSRMKRDLSLEP